MILQYPIYSTMSSTSQPIQSTISSLTGGTHFEQRDVHDLRGKTAIVTGGNLGIGFEVTKTLALAGARVIIVARQTDQANEAISKIKTLAAEDPENTLDMDVEFQQCDLGSLRETKEVADSIREKEERLDLLVCDAGIGATSYALTSDGIEDDFGVNVLGHFLLVNRLLPLMRKTARLPNSDPPRIVSVASSLHQIAPSSTKFASIEEINDPNLRPDAYYDRSKLAIILMTKFGYAQRVIGDKIFALSTHPAAVETGMQDHFKDSYGPILGRMFKTLQYPFMRTPDQGSLSTLWAATSPEIVEKNLQGVYIPDPGRVGGETKQAQDPELADNLWNLNNALVVNKLGQDGLLPWDEVKQ